ncbi:hypothetical protein L915_19093 [Phytophthora nicotianae]|uniref:Uncharacterized protein n=1 Tax=Phytophthora nicotianae TaxID=4792 RepID=W2FTP1_PHYNI|nr:hypothetical protein L915_19093 [Phytophthora nicotianae]
MAREALVEWLKSQNEYDEYIMDHCKDENKAVSAVMKVQKELMYHVPEAMSDIWKLCEVVCANLKEQAIQEWALKKANSSHSKLQRKWQQNTVSHQQNE